MKNSPQIITLGIVLLLLTATHSHAQSIKREPRREPAFPYLLDNRLDDGQAQTVVRVRCLPSKQNQERYSTRNTDTNRRLIRDRILRPYQSNEISIDVEGFCRDIKIRVNEPRNGSNYTFDDNQEYPEYPNHNGVSGWQWFLRNQ
ncbi:hypothetical protein [Brunnivagina elsteri]|uniref:Uncharacterized protein n=1 Tax=Brunnivagina elsteri CCALA 953 TaxID=987040 RepID=A0A2A2TB04_9CYAN|nr:hypothetical protein [Calothrix elsteri]PAX48305.1 hypothetical protein CK510_28270 [Calothrix elsteri CCALA 953]